MPGQDRRPVYKFGAWEIDLARREMRLNGIQAEVGSRAFEIIGTLVQSAGELVDKYDLMNRVWPGAVVEGKYPAGSNLRDTQGVGSRSGSIEDHSGSRLPIAGRLGH